MNNSCGQCYKCKNFDRYYTKGVKQFDKTQIGWCYVNRKDVNIHDCCDKYELKTRRGICKITLRSCLNDLLNELSSIRQVFEADNE